MTIHHMYFMREANHDWSGWRLIPKLLDVFCYWPTSAVSNKHYQNIKLDKSLRAHNSEHNETRFYHKTTKLNSVLILWKCHIHTKGDNTWRLELSSHYKYPEALIQQKYRLHRCSQLWKSPIVWHSRWLLQHQRLSRRLFNQWHQYR